MSKHPEHKSIAGAHSYYRLNRVDGLVEHFAADSLGNQSGNRLRLQVLLKTETAPFAAIA